MPIITIAGRNYHGPYSVRVRASIEQAAEIESARNSGDPTKQPDCVYLLPVSAAVARRVNNAVCGVKDCCCGSRLAYEDAPGGWKIPFGPVQD